MDEIKIYMAFHQQSLKSFYERRIFEWKFNFVYWTPLAIIIGFGIRGNIINNPFSGRHSLLFISHSAMFLLYFFWTIFLSGANKIDKKWAFKYKDAIIHKLLNPNVKIPEVESYRAVNLKIALSTLKDWSPMIPMLITITLLAFSMYVFWK